MLSRLSSRLILADFKRYGDVRAVHPASVLS